jgi:hypothetical protein
VTYDWSSGRIIALFVVFGVAITTFVALQIILGDRATVPAEITRQQTIAFASFFGICGRVVFCYDLLHSYLGKLHRPSDGMVFVNLLIVSS